MASPAPKSPEQSEKAKKYDRQLRLWGDHGQAALEAGHVCLINATGLGTEILKSIVLPGIGSFTIIDGAKVTEEDCCTNFFVDPESIGKPRAESATQLLLELNPDVKGDYVDEDVEHLLENSPDFFNNFSVVIATSLPERKLLPLAKKLWEVGVPLLFCRSYGMACSIRVQVPEHTVAESHPDSIVPDLRIDRPFPGLQAHFESVDFESLEQKDKAHSKPFWIMAKAVRDFVENEGGGCLPLCGTLPDMTAQTSRYVALQQV
ncbi:hypothetical protein J437_LFUL014879 [Ladona fulva]|uniref:THIF-type NAD/FAD binding fold domain-containing protein n=1 Tax=Ladona fulva TaxID=123851 RepID=A0A8K0KI35_LADFU|nr:hypothetical protein J437_LFUL014879 [Ladona fulva]